MSTKVPVKQEFVGPWLEAMRSGKYVQIKGMLVHRGIGGDVTGYCALGLLGKVSGAFHHEAFASHPELHATCYSESTPYRRMTNFEDMVERWNDWEDFSFEEIADKIEELL